MDWLDVRDLKEREKNNGRGMEWAVGQEVSYPHVVGVRVARFHFARLGRLFGRFRYVHRRRRRQRAVVARVGHAVRFKESKFGGLGAA